MELKKYGSFFGENKTDVEDDSASIICNLEVFKQAAFINANKNFEDSDDCGD